MNHFLRVVRRVCLLAMTCVLAWPSLGAPGVTAGPNAPSSVFVYSGSLAISPDRNTLYYGQQGLSPTTLYKLDVSTPTLTNSQSITTGSNGHEVVLNHSGSIVAHPNGAPYEIPLLRTSDLVALGTLNAGAYPSAIAFSPDDAVAYAYV